jgi:hypothetical protein
MINKALPLQGNCIAMLHSRFHWISFGQSCKVRFKYQNFDIKTALCPPDINPAMKQSPHPTLYCDLATIREVTLGTLSDVVVAYMEMDAHSTLQTSPVEFT